MIPPGAVPLRAVVLNPRTIRDDTACNKPVTTLTISCQWSRHCTHGIASHSHRQPAMPMPWPWAWAMPMAWPCPWAWPWDIYGIMPAIGANQAGNEHVFLLFPNYPRNVHCYITCTFLRDVSSLQLGIDRSHALLRLRPCHWFAWIKWAMTRLYKQITECKKIHTLKSGLLHLYVKLVYVNAQYFNAIYLDSLHFDVDIAMFARITNERHRKGDPKSSIYLTWTAIRMRNSAAMERWEASADNWNHRHLKTTEILQVVQAMSKLLGKNRGIHTYN